MIHCPSSSASISSQSSSLIPQQGSITGASSNQRVDRPLPRFQLFDERVDNNSSRTSAVVTAPKPAGIQLSRLLLMMMMLLT
jgi:hypothetical protein